MIDGMRTGFLRHPNGDRLLPITHINLVIGNDGRSIQQQFNYWDEVIKNLDISSNSGGVLSVSTYEELLALDTTDLSDGAICYVSTEKTYYSYTTDGWEVMTTGSSSGGGSQEDIYSHIWIGPDPPEDDSMIWLDTNSDGIIESETDLNILYNLRDTVKELQTTITILESRVKYLEENGVIVNPDPTPTPDEYDIFLLEDGSSLLLEDGTELLLEVQNISSSGSTLLFEDGTQILLEDGTELLLE